MNNQVVPFMLSSEGRYIWAEKPFCFEVKDGQLIIYSDSEKIEPVKAGKYTERSFTGSLGETLSTFGDRPEPAFFSLPQYNTWIELMYDQNQECIMNYAHKAVETDFLKAYSW